jgi:hypothetical protein
MCGCVCSVPRGSGPLSRFLLLAISVERVFRGMHGNQTTLTCQTDPVPRLRTSSVQSALPTPHTLSPHKLSAQCTKIIDCVQHGGATLLEKAAREWNKTQRGRGPTASTQLDLLEV